jgi:pyridoxamine 5'-phosphate oxidase
MSLSEHSEVLPEVLPGDPLLIVSEWLATATTARLQPNPNAMVLATSTPEGRPSARVVLLKSIVPQPGYIVFYTNYLSAKGRELRANPRAAAVLHWDGLHRQVRIEGAITQAPEADSDAYFASRAWQSRIGAWASEQSEPLGKRSELLEAVQQTARRFGAPTPGSAGADDTIKVTVPRPPHWGGFRLWADAVELWVEGAARIHDRARWTRTLTEHGPGEFRPGAWLATRLQP